MKNINNQLAKSEPVEVMALFNYSRIPCQPLYFRKAGEDKIEITEKAMDFLAEKGWDEQYGARPLKRAVQKYVEDVLAESIISSNLHIGDTISIDLAENGEETVVNIIPNEKKVLEEAKV